MCKRALEKLTLTKLLNLQRTSDIPHYILGFVTDYILTHTAFYNRITKSDLQTLAIDTLNEIIRIFENTTMEEIEATYIELSDIKNVYEHEYERTIEYEITEDLNMCKGAYKILNDYKYELDNFAEYICSLGKFEELVVMWMEENKDNRRDFPNATANWISDPHWFWDVCNCFAMVLQSELNIDLGYTRVYTKFHTNNNSTDNTQVDQAISHAPSTEMSVWMLNKACKELCNLHPHNPEFLYLNIQKNILRIMIEIYGSEKVGVAHGILGGVHPLVDNIICEVACKAPALFSSPAASFEEDMDKKLLYNKINIRLKEMCKQISDLDLMKRICIEALTKVNGGTKPEILENYNQDLAKQIGQIVGETQSGLVKALTDSMATTHTSVFSNPAVMNSEYGDSSVNCFTCYANEGGMPKKFVIDGNFDYVEFWLYDGDGKRIEEKDIKEFKAVMMLEVIQ
ncbi:hypothetical protein FACS189472_09970 [Alphaproteobacteria bacterium]|nr:hypothetical protein FACS189472_09970 [Alphaproteobacteria bacterium]